MDLYQMKIMKQKNLVNNTENFKNFVEEKLCVETRYSKGTNKEYIQTVPSLFFFNR